MVEAENEKKSMNMIDFMFYLERKNGI